MNRLVSQSVCFGFFMVILASVSLASAEWKEKVLYSFRGDLLLQLLHEHNSLILVVADHRVRSANKSRLVERRRDRSPNG